MIKKRTVKKQKKISGPVKKHPFPIVAIGSSAGGLDAMSILLKNLPSNTGMAFIYVQHLSPDHKSFLSTILSKITKMEVQEIEDMELMKPDNVYIIPSTKGIRVTNGHIKLVPRSKSIPTVSIDILFTSLAETHKENVVGIVLSGAASDGTKGLGAIKKAGGLTMAQDESAQAKSMPRSAIAAGVVDFVLSPKEIARKLIRLGKSGLLKRGPKQKRADTIDTANPDLKQIYNLLLKETGVDFSHYKPASIKRRLQHRMQQIETESVKDYVKILEDDKTEINNLYKDILIHVTTFFRDAESFKYLKNILLPRLLKEKLPDQPMRIWIPACSTGEEAYSIAMILAELQETKSNRNRVQIFATDLSDYAIRLARLGEYSKSDLNSLSKERVKRFFVKTGDRYHITKELRETCVFAPHNILSDPPFFKIDFISCRNLLIYFDTAAQKKALGTMNFALKEGGYLMLGKSETIGAASQLFTQVNHKLKIYSRKKNTGSRKLPELTPRLLRKSYDVKTTKNSTPDSIELESAINGILLSRFMPACAIINKDMEILQFRGLTSLYLYHPSGKASLNILKMMRPEFSFELRNAINKAFKTKQVVKKTGIELKIDNISRIMSLEVCPLKIEWDEPLLLIIFTFQEQVEKYIKSSADKKNSSTYQDKKIKKLAEELSHARTEMHSVIELQETAYEELQAANEEIVSTNEEFQTLNEELETSKEEIEASNEELVSTNQELQMRNDLLAESYEYSEAIIATIHEPMLVLNKNLMVKSASKSFYTKFNTTKETTEGVSLFKLGNGQLDIPKLRDLLNEINTENRDFTNFEVTHTFRDLGKRVLLLNAHHIAQKNHREQLILLAIEDVTERVLKVTQEKEILHKELHSHILDKGELEKAVRKRTRQLEIKNKELESANKDLTAFTYVSSHDLQEPLRKIQNFVTCIMLEEEKKLSKTGKDYFLRMQKTAKRMQNLIEDLLAYSKTNSKEHKFENTNLNDIVNDVLIDFEEILKEKKATITVAKIGTAKIIPFQFRQLVHNIISNSLKFAKKNVPPQIHIKCKTIKAGHSTNKNLNSRKNYLNLIFIDNGIGFDPQYQDRIFEVFQRLHSFNEYAGTGIGLAICKRIVDNHNGIITATGKLDKGVRFDVYLPV